MTKSVEFLGHRIDTEGLYLVEGKLEAIVKVLLPKKCSRIKVVFHSEWWTIMLNICQTISHVYTLLKNSQSVVGGMQSAFWQLKECWHLLKCLWIIIQSIGYRCIKLRYRGHICDSSRHGLCQKKKKRHADRKEALAIILPEIYSVNRLQATNDYLLSQNWNACTCTVRIP